MQKRLNQSRGHLGADSCGPKAPCIRWGQSRKKSFTAVRNDRLVILAHRWALQKTAKPYSVVSALFLVLCAIKVHLLTYLRTYVLKLIDVPFKGLTRVGEMNHELEVSRLDESIRRHEGWQDGKAAFCQNSLTTCSYSHHCSFVTVLVQQSALRCRWHWSNVRWFLWCWTHEAWPTTSASVTLLPPAFEHQKTNTLRQYRKPVVSSVNSFLPFQLLFINCVICKRL